MSYLLDTNAVSLILKRKDSPARHRLKAAIEAGESVVLSAIVMHELWYGVARSADLEKNAERVRILASGLSGIIPFTEEDAVLAGRLRAELASRGELIGPFDLLIAAQALRIDATLVTGNVREFARVKGLKWENWVGA